jgi:hypothetical protein
VKQVLMRVVKQMFVLMMMRMKNKYIEWWSTLHHFWVLLPYFLSSDDNGFQCIFCLSSLTFTFVQDYAVTVTPDFRMKVKGNFFARDTHVMLRMLLKRERERWRLSCRTIKQQEVKDEGGDCIFFTNLGLFSIFKLQFRWSKWREEIPPLLSRRERICSSQ